MNQHRIFQEVPGHWVERGMQFGRDMAAYYESPQGRISRSRAVSGNRGTEKNPKRLSQGRVGEIAAILYFHLDPEILKWTQGADAGFDFNIGRTKIDVKTTFPHYNLIWSNTINEIYLKEMFDVLISVSIDENDFAKCWIEGWVSKLRFFRRKRIADGISKPLLEKDTWWIPKADLHRMGVFPGYSDDPREHYCWCGEWGSFGSARGFFCADHR